MVFRSRINGVCELINLLEVKNLNFSYSNNKISGSSNFNLFDNTFIVEEKDFISVIGKNGSGKSTLVKLLSRILSGYSGYIYYNGQDIRSIEKKEFSRALSYLPQTTATFNEDLTVKEFLMLGRYAHKKFTDFYFSNDDKNVVAECIKETGISNLENHNLYKLSGGEKQKVLLTLGLVQLDITGNLNEKILIIDEPLTYLDINYQFEIFSILKNLNDKGLTIIIVIHDLNLALNFTNKTLLMNEGKVIRFEDSNNVITKETLNDYFHINSEIIKHENNYLINYSS